VRLLAIRGKSKKCVNMFLEYSTSICGSLRAGATAQLLLDAGADSSIANVAGDTAMHIAIFWKSLNVLDNLVKSVANFSLLNSKGESPLHAVARECDPEIMKILKRSPSVLHVDLHTKNREGKSCFNYLPEDEEKKRVFEVFLDENRGIAGGEDDGGNEIYEDAPEFQ
jgi:ankyrin repeat protein